MFQVCFGACRWYLALLLIHSVACSSNQATVEAFVRQPIPPPSETPAAAGRFHLRSGAVKLQRNNKNNYPPRRSRIQQFTARRLSALKKNGEESENNNKSKATDALPLSQRTKGLLVLLTVPVAWGTYVPVVRYLYAIQPAVPGFVFSASYYAIASVTTLAMVTFQDRKAKNSEETMIADKDAISLTPADEETDADDGAVSAPFPILAGIELGAYLFVANCLQVIGLKTVPSDRAGFLVQLTTVMVPVAEALLAGNLLAIPAQTWFSCLLAFAGICVMNLDGLGGSGISTMLGAFKTFTQGDVLILSAAVLYTLHVVRLGRYAKESTPLKLAASKATVETVYSFCLVLALMTLAGSGIGAASSGGLLSFAQETGAEISNFFSTISQGLAAGTVPKSAILSALGATLWTGLVTCAYTIYAQSYGQRRVGPTTANLVYSIQPITTSLFAFLLLGETMGPAGVVGGALIGAALYLVTTGGNSVESEDGESSIQKSMPLKINGENESSKLVDTEEDYVGDVERR